MSYFHDSPDLGWYDYEIYAQGFSPDEIINFIGCYCKNKCFNIFRCIY